MQRPDGWQLMHSGEPQFSPDGKYLYFRSNRDFNPTFSNTDFEIAYLNMSKIYILPLSKETANPFAPVNNEVAIQGDSAAAAKDGDKKKTPEKPKASKDSVIVKIDAENITSRIMPLKMDAASYYNISPIEGARYIT